MILFVGILFIVIVTAVVVAAVSSVSSAVANEDDIEDFSQDLKLHIFKKNPLGLQKGDRLK